MDYIELGYLGLFIVCFLSATILPLTSEGVLLLFLATSFDPVSCLLVATLGNSLGGLTNYWLGMLGKVDLLKRFFKKPSRYERLVVIVDKYGYWLGLLSWTPILGDPLTLALGFFRVRFFPFLLLMVLGKFVRYYFIIFLWSYTQ
ncbi:MAG: DedA family protein [Crocinitomicaceae bacterium]|nr:DedA family protein [Crocinitomicaceae bacterium]